MGPSVTGMLTICSNGTAPLKRMADMPVYGKNTSKSSQKLKALRLNVGIQHWELKIYQVYLNDETRIFLTILFAWSNLCPSCYGNARRVFHGICRYA